MIKGAFLFSIAVIAAVFLTCTDLGGIGHEGEARISGQLVLPDGIPAAQTQVALYPEDYDPVKNSRTVFFETTDAQGSYLFSQVSPGSYTILAVNSDHKIRMLISGIRITGKDVGIPIHTMVKTGAMKVFLPSDVTSATGYVYIPGTKLFAFLNNRTDFVVIDSIPAGIIPDVAYSSTNGAATNIIRYDVPVPSNDTAVVCKPSWKYARQVCLNTTPIGADVTGNVMNFPVCIRISSADFNFDQARTNGADIRFAKMDNTELPYEIERWDPVTELAEAWVLVDTVFGNNSSQSLMMYWGNAAAMDSSSGTAVFDTASRFQGVWHMNENGNDPAYDATPNHYSGNAYHMSDNSLISGAVGKARVFDGESSYIAMPNTANSKLNFPEDGYFTVSAWVCADTMDNANTSNYEYQTIVAKGHQQYFLQLTTFPSYKPMWEFSNFRETSKWNMSTSPAIENQWVLLTGVVQGSSQYLYCNGDLVASTTTNYSQNASRDASDDFTIGRFFKEATIPAIGFCYFKGKIDEVRISSVARNSDWIRLNYMNQRSDDRLVQFK